MKMEDVFLFIHAALPLVAIGLFLAVLFARNAYRKEKKEKYNDYGTEGMCLGMCFGTAVGTALGNNTGIGISFGMLIGLAIGMCIEKKDCDNKDEK